MESFKLFEQPETITFKDYPELINPNLTLKDIKQLIKGKTGIKEENQRFVIRVNHDNFLYGLIDDYNFWEFFELKIYDKSRYYTGLKRDFYETEVILDLTRKVEELKEMIFEQVKIPKERIEFYLDKKKLDDDYSNLGNANLITEDLTIKVTKFLNDVVYLKYPNSEIKEIKTDLCNTGIEFLKEVEPDALNINSSEGFSVKYDLYCNNKEISFDNILFNSGIKNGDTIELRKRTNNIRITLMTLTKRKFILNVSPNDTIRLFKFFLRLIEGIPLEQQRIIFDGKQLEGKKSFADYNIKNESTLHLVLRLG